LHLIVADGQIGRDVTAPGVGRRALVAPVSTFLTVTIAPGMVAPEASCTTPEMVPVLICAEARKAPKIKLMQSIRK
jgi:hypothetical protein